MTRNTSTSPRLVLAILTVGLLTAAVSVASAQECGADADCSEGFHCELYGGETCVVAPGQTEPDCGEPVMYGECVRSPITCTTDADCPTYLSCITGGGEGDVPVGGACEADANGNCIDQGAPQEDPMPTASFCGYREIQCGSNADCPSDFECVDYAQSGGDCAAPAIACDPDDPNCVMDVPNCEPVEPTVYSACQPREIACDADTDCPSDWRCITESWGYCDGSAGNDTTEGDAAPEDPNGGSGAIAPADNNGGAPAECYEETVSRCLPAGLVDYYGSGGGSSTDDGSEPGRDENSDGIFAGNGGDGGNSRSSCSTINLSPTAGGLPIAALLILGLALIPLRRR